MNYFVYVLKSTKDGKRYIGSTNDINRRLSEHNSGKSFSTKNRTPFVLIYKEEYETEKEARQREKSLKTHRGYNTLMKLINGL
jgi:putative endonuclease